MCINRTKETVSVFRVLVSSISLQAQPIYPPSVFQRSGELEISTAQTR
jgi:hypothetical protein